MSDYTAVTAVRKNPFPVYTGHPRMGGWIYVYVSGQRPRLIDADLGCASRDPSGPHALAIHDALLDIARPLPVGTRLVLAAMVDGVVRYRVLTVRSHPGMPSEEILNA